MLLSRFIYEIYFLIVFLAATCFSAVPFLIWGSGDDLIKDYSPPISNVDTSAFYSDVLKKIVSSNNPRSIVVFIEKSLSPEDFQSYNGETPYDSLKNIAQSGGLMFFRSVDEPVEAIKMLIENGYDIITADEDTPILDGRMAYLIDLEDAKIDENRPDMLRRHDKFIRDTCEKFQANVMETMCVLTAYNNAWTLTSDNERVLPVRNSIRKREAPNVSNNGSGSDNIYFVPKLALVFTKSAPLLQEIGSDKEAMPLLRPTVRESNDSLIVEFEPNSSETTTLVFNFTLSNGEWQLKSINMEKFNGAETNNVLVATKGCICAENAFSYHVAQPVVFNDTQYRLTFNGLQAEYLFGSERSSFSIADDPVYFFTIPILSGLLVTGLILAIILMGLTMITDIKTMDQFDDPKGKPLTINASD